jgi:hypothetical protein
VDTALFFSILDAKPRAIFGTLKNAATGKREPYAGRNQIDRRKEPERFDAIMAEFNEKAARFAESVKKGMVRTGETAESECRVCRYRRVCRPHYQVGGEAAKKGVLYGTD